MMEGKSWQQECEVAGHIASVSSDTVLGSLSHFYSVLDIHPWDGPPHDLTSSRYSLTDMPGSLSPVILESLRLKISVSHHREDRQAAGK